MNKINVLRTVARRYSSDLPAAVRSKVQKVDNVPDKYAKVKAQYKLFQIEDGVPIYLKKWYDRPLYATAIFANVGITCFTLYYIVKLIT